MSQAMINALMFKNAATWLLLQLLLFNYEIILYCGGFNG
jgi:hypothetical protein